MNVATNLLGRRAIVHDQTEGTIVAVWTHGIELFLAVDVRGDIHCRTTATVTLVRQSGEGKCGYPHHHADCECNGEGGGR